MIEVAKLRSTAWVAGSGPHLKQIEHIEETARQMAAVIDAVSERTGNA